ncbi:MAG TPA: hypothetical protein PLW67_11515 [Prolixibacteraceae bacterium]|nr:hypothetical protein [Prolixibacteraceae bacterium]
MQTTLLDLESKLYGTHVFRMSEIENAGEVVRQHQKLGDKYNTLLIYSILDANKTGIIQQIEKLGYGFCEFRIHSYLEIIQKPSIPDCYPFQLQLVGDDKQLEEVKKILKKGQPDDRFFNDPLLDKEFARQRELLNIGKSFHSWPKEFLLGLFNTQSGKLVAFRSGGFKNEKEVSFYLYGVIPNMDKDHSSRMLDHLCIDYLYQMGVRIIHSVSTGFNTPELNRLILHHGFRIESAEVVLRWKKDHEKYEA